jgi:hypothetical protein
MAGAEPRSDPQVFPYAQDGAPVQPLKTLPAVTIPIAASRMFTYPTRLASAWKPGILEINCPGYTLERAPIALASRQGSTEALGIKHGRSFRRAFRKVAEPLKVEDGWVCDARYETDGNIAHLLTVVAPPPLAARDVAPRTTVVLRAKATGMAQAAYKLLGFEIVCTDREVEGNLLMAASGAQGTFEGHYRAMFGALPFEGYREGTPERVFISRRGPRSLVNEPEVHGLLEKYGYHKVYFEDIPMAEQWSWARNARVVVALHGAALASLVFNRRGVKLIELFHPGYVVDMYRHLVNAVGGSWVGITGQMPPNLIRDLDEKGDARSFAAASPRIAPETLELALRHMEVAPA